jgi:hypothetical protein
MKIGLMTAAAAAVLALSTQVFAQAPTAAPAAKPATQATPAANTTVTTADYTEQHIDGNQVVTFPGDPLPGDQNSAYGFTIRRPPGVLRAGLIRPRVNFVPELLKSVENL